MGVRVLSPLVEKAKMEGGTCTCSSYTSLRSWEGLCVTEMAPDVSLISKAPSLPVKRDVPCSSEQDHTVAQGSCAKPHRVFHSSLLYLCVLPVRKLSSEGLSNLS